MPENLEELSDQMLADRLRDTAKRMKAAITERDALILEAGRRKQAGNPTWTQEKIAALADLSQQAVSLQLRKNQSANSGDTTE